MPDRTEIHWTYDPPDFFEADHVFSNGDYSLSAKDGELAIALSTPQSPIPKDLDERIREQVTLLFRARRMQNRRTYVLQGPRIEQHEGSGKTTSVPLSGIDSISVMGIADICVVDPSGKVTGDTKAERIANLEDLVLAAQRSPVLASLLASLERADSDPADFLVHLYEVRDGLAKCYAGANNARLALGISDWDWSWFGKLANKEPLNEGRHRGQNYTSLRDATPDELDKAWKMIETWIEAFAATV